VNCFKKDPPLLNAWILVEVNLKNLKLTEDHATVNVPHDVDGKHDGNDGGEGLIKWALVFYFLLNLGVIKSKALKE
jgi:hypothetical protein